MKKYKTILNFQHTNYIFLKKLFKKYIYQILIVFKQQIIILRHNLNIVNKNKKYNNNSKKIHYFSLEE